MNNDWSGNVAKKSVNTNHLVGEIYEIARDKSNYPKVRVRTR